MAEEKTRKASVQKEPPKPRLRLPADHDKKAQRYPALLVDAETAKLTGQRPGTALTVTKAGVPVSAALARAAVRLLERNEQARQENCRAQIEALRSRLGDRFTDQHAEEIEGMYPSGQIFIVEGVN